MKNKEKLLLLLMASLALLVGQVIYQLQENKEYSEYIQVYEPARLINDFKLYDQENSKFNKSHLTGKWSFVFLGYLSCPDICPLTMAKLSAALPEISEITDEKSQVLFLSVDPKRDTAEARKEYVAYFNNNIIGLGAEHKDLFPFVRNLGLMYTVPDQNAENYFVDHSASIVLINPNAEIAAIFKPKVQKGQVPTVNTEQMLKDFKQLLD